MAARQNREGGARDFFGIFGNDKAGIQAISQYTGELDAHRDGSFAKSEQTHAAKIGQVVLPSSYHNDIAGAADKASHGGAWFHGGDGSGEDAGDGIPLPGQA